MKLGAFKDAKSRDRFHAAYEQTLADLWPGARETLDVATAFGTTRAYRAGPPGDRPIVLLSGAGGNALMWHRYIDALSRRHRVIAVDTVGEPGASVQTAPIGDGRDGAAWLEELLGALEVAEAHLVGCSYGGWLALQHQIHHPGRTASLTLVDPAGFADPGWRFFTWAIGGGLAGTAPRPLRPFLARLVANSTILETELMRMMRRTMSFRRGLPPAQVFTDEELRRVQAPSLFLLGARSALHDSRQVADRLAQLIPAARVEIVPGAGHALPTDRPELVTDRILKMAGQQKTP
ncbi:alpha/beta hydrolase [Actinomadura sp. NPDC047616]|uniref:alpha/beta fold hydrolase n=1 Tax=Actinomadura sp. NPDC047616 TaxID=3155914 RepID=UPI00340E87D2